MHIFHIIGGVSVTLEILIPDAWAEERKQNGKVVWLMHGTDEAADVWGTHTQVEYFSNCYGVAIIAPSMGRAATYADAEPGCTWETFFTQGLWEYVHEIIPALSLLPEDQLLFGRDGGALAAVRFGERYPERYGCVATFQSSDGDWGLCNVSLRQEIERFTGCV